ncbi:MAG: hypothetical protein ABIR17_03550 [Pseudolysinimonas sp.]|uniref:hypothetical protein n=1 Tax=Pseudolysinimonas sp. TaxID=2680009 RepID=UPI003265AB6F
MTESPTDKPAAFALARRVTSALREDFHGAARSFTISNLQEDGPLIAFSVRFEVYGYFPIVFNYDRGFFGFAIAFGEVGVSVLGSLEGGSLDDLPALLEEFDRRIRLRIPDKYLDAYTPSG